MDEKERNLDEKASGFINIANIYFDQSNDKKARDTEYFLTDIEKEVRISEEKK